MNTVLLLLPDFSLILLGILIRRWMTFGENFWAGLEKLVYFILFPALLINSLVKARLDLLSAFPLLATAFAAIVAGMLLGLLPRCFSKVPALTFASMYQCAFRYNSYIGLAVVSMLFGQSGVGVFVAPSVIEQEIRAQYDVAVVGRSDEIVERFYAITVERRLKHPGVIAISSAARHDLFERGRH